MTYDGRTRVLIMSEPKADAVDMVMRHLPALKSGEALVKIRHAGICGTDLHIIGWNKWAARSYSPPFALGHEFLGEIVDLREGSPFAVGDRVTAETHLACGHCAQCRAGRAHTCDNLSTFSRLDRGAFADYSVVPVKLLRKVPDAVPDRVGAILEPLGISIRCVSEAGCAGKLVLVSGCGPIGLMAIASARHFGAARIWAADPAPRRRTFALAMGAATATDPAERDVAETIREEAEHGADLVIETSGAPAAIAAGLRAATRGGDIVMAGLPAEDVPLDLTGQVVLREVTVRGVYGRRIDRTWLDMERALLSGLDIEGVITHSYRLESFVEAIRTARGADAGKVLLDMSCLR